MEKEPLFTSISYRIPIKILHIDDEPMDLEITRVFLKRVAKEKFEIESVLSPEEALDKLKSEQFDVVISDYKMPRMNGIELLEVLRKSENPTDHLPFILFTGRGGVEVAEDALNRGADRYLTKYGNPSVLFNGLAHMIQELVKENQKGKADKNS